MRAGEVRVGLTYVDDVSGLLADDLMVPLPDFCGDGLAYGAEHTEVLHLVLHVIITCPLEQSQRGGSNVELRHAVLLAHIPVPAEVGIRGRALEDNRRDTEEQGRVDHVCVTGNPADITTAEEAIGIVDVEDVFTRSCRTEQVSGSGVHDTLRLSGRTRGVE